MGLAGLVHQGRGRAAGKTTVPAAIARADAHFGSPTWISQDLPASQVWKQQSSSPAKTLGCCRQGSAMEGNLSGRVFQHRNVRLMFSGFCIIKALPIADPLAKMLIQRLPNCFLKSSMLLCRDQTACLVTAASSLAQWQHPTSNTSRLLRSKNGHKAQLEVTLCKRFHFYLPNTSR